MLILEHFHVFVGDLATEIDNNALKAAFAAYGEISLVLSEILCFLRAWKYFDAFFGHKDALLLCFS